MATISLCMIVRNEEDVLERCLKSIKDVVDEIILVDTGSSDRTKEIAGQYTDKVFDYQWEDDFAAARNYSFSKAGMEYQMWLDADDVLEPEDRKVFLAMKAELEPETDVVMLPYHVAFDEEGRPVMTYYRERIVKRSRSFSWSGAVHEAIAPAGRIIYGEAAICHRKVHPSDPDRNLRIYEQMRKQGEIKDPRHQFYYGRELYYHERYEEAKEVLEHFLREGNGWSENCISACLNLSECLSRLGKTAEALTVLFWSFRFDEPRPEICCAVGDWFFNQGEPARAVYWYLLAKEQKTDEKSGAFVNPDCHEFIPDVQLCVCYDRLGQREKALQYHALAKARKPSHPSVLYNDAYFKQPAKEK